MRVCVYIHSPWCIHCTHAGTQCACWVCAPPASHGCRGCRPLQVAPWALGPQSSSPGHVPLYLRCVCQEGSCHPTLSPVGGLGTGFAPMHSPSRALCWLLVQHSPWGCAVPAAPVPQQEGWHAATSRAQPCALVTSGTLGQGPNSFQPGQHRGSQGKAGAGERRGAPAGWQCSETAPCPQPTPLQP